MPATTIDHPSQITKCMRPTWGPPGSCRPQMGPMLAPWTLLSGLLYKGWVQETWCALCALNKGPRLFVKGLFVNTNLPDTNGNCQHKYSQWTSRIPHVLLRSMVYHRSQFKAKSKYIFVWYLITDLFKKCVICNSQTTFFENIITVD